MKKLLTTLLVLSVAGSAAMAAQTYTERAAKKFVAPVAKKEAEATRKLDKAHNDAQARKQAVQQVHQQNQEALRREKNLIKDVKRQNENALKGQKAPNRPQPRPQNRPQPKKK